MKNCECKEPEPNAFDLWLYRQMDTYFFQPILIPVIERLIRLIELAVK
jgi:hypothetical protein